MNYRLAQKTDIDRLVSMAESAKAYFRENGIDQWQKGEPNAACMLDAIGRQEIYVLEEDGEVMAMITIVSGPEPSYAAIDGAWLNEEPYCAFHRVCVDSEKKGPGDWPPSSSPRRKAPPALWGFPIYGSTHTRTTAPCREPWKRAASSAAAA